MILTETEMVSLVERELAEIRDPARRAALAVCLVPPSPHFVRWDFDDPGKRRRCWVVARDPNSDLAIAYCPPTGDQPAPWFSFFLTDDSFGRDAPWYGSLEQALEGSGMAPPIVTGEE